MEPTFDLAVVVDDDPDISLAAKLALRDMFERIEALRSPAELLPFLKRESPDAILLDLNFERAASCSSGLRPSFSAAIMRRCAGRMCIQTFAAMMVPNIAPR